MARILSFGNTGSNEQRQNLVKNLWEYYSTFDNFTKLFIITVILFIITVPFAAQTVLNLRQTAATADVYVQINLDQPLTISKMDVGVTHVAKLSGIDTSAKGRVETLLKNGVRYNNRLIYGFGVGNPNPSKGVYNWDDLDAAVDQLRSLNANLVLTLCCSPEWMSDLNTTTETVVSTETALKEEHFQDFANLAEQIARRYPDVLYFQVWKDLKGFNQDIVLYTKFYNLIYNSLKSVNPNIKVGGPYLSISKQEQEKPISDSTLNKYDYWLANKTGADFINLNYSIVANGAKAQLLDSIIDNTKDFATIANQIKTRPNFNNLSIWWAEDYCDANLSKLDYMSDDFQVACLASLLNHELISGSAVSLRFPAGGDSTKKQPNTHSLFSDPAKPNGGMPYPSFEVYKTFNDYFGPGTQIYPALASSKNVEVLASKIKTLLINKRNAKVSVSVNDTVITLNPYQVLLINTPVPTPFVQKTN